jgi:hypothetical protein
MDDAFAFLDRAAEEQREHNEERRQALRFLKKDIEEDEKEALSLMRKLERSSET